MQGGLENPPSVIQFSPFFAFFAILARGNFSENFDQDHDQDHDFEVRKGSGLDFQHGDMSKIKALTPS